MGELNVIHSVRRSSVFPSAARQSMLPGSNNASAPSQIRGTRPITNPTWRQIARTSIEDYLSLTHCPILINTKTLNPSPTQANFVAIFRYLVSDILGIEMASAATKKFEDEAILVLKDLRYPLVDVITKTSLGTAGNERNWTTLLPMLSWLVDLCKVCPGRSQRGGLRELMGGDVGK
jgi:kinetochore protein NDC80